MKPAVIVIDMVKDNVPADSDSVMAVAGRAIIPAINRVTGEFRARGLSVVFASDSFLEGDFIFGGKMNPHAIRGTRGAELVPDLVTAPEDIILPKRRFSAFYKTDLDQTLRMRGADTVALCGIATHFCVLATAFDALSNDFRAMILEDCCASYNTEAHENTLESYRKNPLFPLFRVMKSGSLVSELQG